MLFNIMWGRKKSSIMMDEYGKAAWYNGGVRFLFSADNSRKPLSIQNFNISFRN